jgi:Staphylococcal nuclease homologue
MLRKRIPWRRACDRKVFSMTLPLVTASLSLGLIDGRNINLAMVQSGFAEAYRGPQVDDPYKQEYQAAEATAQQAILGMWALEDKYESPRDYRRRLGINESSFPNSNRSNQCKNHLYWHLKNSILT